MTAKATRTLNPLHFEDLEPHRFEDLVRQLAYDFREWERIEATGRLGSDDGIDIRALEKSRPPLVANVEAEDEEPTDLSAGHPTEKAAADRAEPRSWFIQCKRMARIGPSKVRMIISESLPGGADPPYGFLLAAACDFSKAARDAFHEELLKRGVRESHLWGKAELEDMLLLPKYDHLLFAYFNISIQIRRRSLHAELRSRIALKRQLVHVLGDVDAIPAAKSVLLRDPREERYPRADRIPDFKEHPRWWYFEFRGHLWPDHLAFVRHRYFAYLDDEGQGWDAYFDHDNQNNARVAFLTETEERGQSKIYEAWSSLPQRNQAWLEVLRLVPYERILGIDPFGDNFNDGPHLFVEFDVQDGPFAPDKLRVVVRRWNDPPALELEADLRKRINRFQGLSKDKGVPIEVVQFSERLLVPLVVED